MSVWFCIPSIRPLAELQICLQRWRSMGYRIALLRQGESAAHLCDLEIPTNMYLGWARSTNILCREVLSKDPACNWCVGGGDDYLPDLAHTAEEIAVRCSAHFGGSFGVMQTTGDRWCDTPDSRRQYGENRGAIIDRIAGSPWLGREWCARSYQGNGPMCDEYHHIFADEELQEVAFKLGVFWQCRDLIQLHEHPLRRSGGNESDWPDFLKPINTPENWQREMGRFHERKAAGFPGSEPLPARETVRL